MTKRLRDSERMSSERTGRCAMSTVLLLSHGRPPYDASCVPGCVARRPLHLCTWCGPLVGRRPPWWADGIRRRASVLGVELGDERVGGARVDLGPRRQLVDQDLQAARDDLHPGRDRTVAEGLARQL